MEQELIARATRIYARTCEQEGSVYQQPGNVESSFDAKTQTVYGQPRDAYQGTRPPAEAQPREHARLLSCRPSGRLVLVLIERHAPPCAPALATREPLCLPFAACVHSRQIAQRDRQRFRGPATLPDHLLLPCAGCCQERAHAPNPARRQRAWEKARAAGATDAQVRDLVQRMVAARVDGMPK